MYKFTTIILLICCVTNIIAATKTLLHPIIEGIREDDKGIFSTEINYQPVWDEIDDEEIRTQSHYEKAAIDSDICHFEPIKEIEHIHHVPGKFPVHASQVIHHYIHLQSQGEERSRNCTAPNGLGLTNLLRESLAILPLGEMQKIIIEAVTADQEVQSFVKLFRSPDFHALLHAFRQTNEYDLLSKYTCKDLYFELGSYGDFIGSLPNFNADVAVMEVFKGRSGLSGLLQDLRDILPKSQLRNIYQRLMELDEYLVESISTLKSKEFRQLFRNVRTTREYKKLFSMLLTTGLPLYDVKELLGTALDRDGDEFDGSEMILKN